MDESIIMRCEYCNHRAKFIFIMDDDLNQKKIFRSPKNSRDGNNICKQYGHKHIQINT